MSFDDKYECDYTGKSIGKHSSEQELINIENDMQILNDMRWNDFDIATTEEIVESDDESISHDWSLTFDPKSSVKLNLNQDDLEAWNKQSKLAFEEFESSEA
jgi:hypothetical protein